MSQDYVNLARDDDLGILTSREFEVLSRHHQSETWVWDRMTESAEREGTVDGMTADECRGIADYHRNRTRNFKELAAEEERLQTEYEREHGTEPSADA